MIIHKELFGQLYESIKLEFPSSDNKKLTVFVSAADCDSVCALRILSVCPLLQTWDDNFRRFTRQLKGLTNSLHRRFS